MIRLTIPSIDEEDLQAVRKVIQSGYLVQGPMVEAFEAAVAEYVGVKYAVAVSNCTAALHMALLALEVGAGDRVAVTTYSWPATANVIALCGAEPVFVDIEPRTFNMDPNALASVLRTTEVKAILPVHTFGGLADMPKIVDIANEYAVPVIEDAACALGTELDGRQAGAWGTMGCFSFHPRKAITTGEGGIVTTDDPKLARVLRALRNHGIDPSAPSIDFVMAGFNYRLTEFQAAFGLTQMKKLDRIIEARRSRARIYDELLVSSEIETPHAIANSRHVYQTYVVLLPREVVSYRQDVITALRSRGVEATIGTYHMPLLTYYRQRGGYAKGDFPVTDDVAARSLSLPLHESLTLQEQQTVVTVLKEEIARCLAAN